MCCCCCFSEGETRKFYLFLKKEKKIKRTRNATCWKSIPGERERESSGSGGRRRLLYSFVREWNRKSGYGEEGRRGFFCLKNCYQLLLLHHHHAKGATCAFQFLTAAIVDNPKGERKGGGEGKEIIDTQWHQRTVKK